METRTAISSPVIIVNYFPRNAAALSLREKDRQMRSTPSLVRTER